MRASDVPSPADSKYPPEDPEEAMRAIESRSRLAISFSGGRTSAYMTDMLLGRYRDTHEVVVTFANTGCGESCEVGADEG